MHFSALCQRCAIKIIDFATVEIRDPRTNSSNTTIICYLETENAWCDSGTELCLSKDAAREEAARRFLELLEEHDFDDKKIDNLRTRSVSPACTAGRAQTDKRVRSTLLDPDEIPIRRAKSTSPRPKRSMSMSAANDARPRRGLLKSIKSMFGRRKSPRY